MTDYIHRYVDAALATSEERGDVIAALDLYGPQGFPMTFLGHCDVDGNYTTKLTGYEHASVVLRRTDNWTVLRNSELEQEVGYNDADLRAIYDGCVYVLHRSPVVNPSPVPSPPPPTNEDDEMTTSRSFLHTNGSRHSLWIRKGDMTVHHTVWGAGASQPESMPVSNGLALSIIDLFQEPSGVVVGIIQGSDAKEYFTTGLSSNADLSPDVHAAWLQR